MKHLTLAATLTLALGATASRAENLDFTLVNNSGFNLIELYTSPATMDDWREDILGQQVMATGLAGTVTITDGSDQCVYDLRMVFEDGDVIEDTADLCAAASYTIN